MDPEIKTSPVPDGTPTYVAPAQDSRAAEVGEKTGAQENWINPNEVNTMGTNAVKMGGKAWVWWTVAGVVTTLVILLAGTYYFYKVRGGNPQKNSGVVAVNKSKTDCSSFVSEVESSLKQQSFGFSETGLDNKITISVLTPQKKALYCNESGTYNSHKLSFLWPTQVTDNEWDFAWERGLNYSDGSAYSGNDNFKNVTANGIESDKTGFLQSIAEMNKTKRMLEIGSPMSEPTFEKIKAGVYFVTQDLKNEKTGMPTRVYHIVLENERMRLSDAQHSYTWNDLMTNYYYSQGTGEANIVSFKKTADKFDNIIKKIAASVQFSD